MTNHIATSVELGRTVRRGLRLPVGFVSDNLLVGPCSKNYEQHIRLRCDFWGLQGRQRSRFRSSWAELIGALQSPQPLVVWTSHLWSDIVALWGLCAWRLHDRPEPPDLKIVFLGKAEESGFGCGSLHLTPAEAGRSLELGSALSLTRVRELSRFWRKLSGPSPLLCAEEKRPSTRGKAFAELGAFQAGFFPRMKGRALCLSRFDELLFSCIEEGGATPLEVFVNPGPAGKELRKWLTMTGDIFLALRLRRWAEHRGAEAALECVPHRPDRSMLEARYRLSKAGDAIKKVGLAEIAQGAPLWVWGVQAYDPLAPWVVRAEAGREAFSLL
jgi:hypothetical protein